MSKRLIFPVALALVGGLWLVNSARSEASPAEVAAPATPAAEPTPAPGVAFPAAEGELPVLNKWFALGSGCRAKDDLAGDVTMEALPQDPARPNTYRVRFHLDQLKLDSAALKDKSLLKFAKECSIRLNINPPAGKRITRVTADTAVRVDKQEGAKLTVLSELKIGNNTLGRDEAKYAGTEVAQAKESALSLVPGTRLDETFPRLECAEPKIIGVNYTWLAERSAATESVSVELAGKKTLDVEAELSPCN